MPLAQDLLKILFLSLSLSSCARRPNNILLPTFLLLAQIEVINYTSVEYAVSYSDTYAAYTSHIICSETNNESVYRNHSYPLLMFTRTQRAQHILVVNECNLYSPQNHLFFPSDMSQITAI